MSDSIPYRLSSLTIVLPFYNDAGTVNQMISDAYTFGTQVTNQLTVIAIHGGLSTDDTYTQILFAQSMHPDLLILDESHSGAGYAVIATGLKRATSEWVFILMVMLNIILTTFANLFRHRDRLALW